MRRALLQGVRRFGRHVVLVVLGQHFIGLQHALRIELAQGDDALAFAEQVGQDAVVAHQYLLNAVGNAELHRQAVRRAAQRPVLHQAAGADACVQRRFAGGDLTGGIKQVDILLQGGQGQRDGDAHPTCQGRQHDQPSLALGGHRAASRRSRRASNLR